MTALLRRASSSLCITTSHIVWANPVWHVCHWHRGRWEGDETICVWHVRESWSQLPKSLLSILREHQHYFVSQWTGLTHSKNLLDLWVPEIKLFCPTVPIILVATKSELRDDEGIRKKLATQGYEPINTIEGKALAARIGAYAYLECSAKTKEGVDTALDIISQCAFNEKKRRKRHCRSCQIL